MTTSTSTVRLAVADRVYVLETGQVVHHVNVGELAQHTEILFKHLGVH
jgi:branched-chain amino acid transport system ATP-binding protein